jgi:transmembrane sensor
MNRKSMDAGSALRGQIATEAAEWFVLLHGGVHEATRKDFVQWLLRSPAHVQEFLVCSRVWGSLRVAPDEFSIERLVAEARAESELQKVVELRQRAPVVAPEKSMPRRARSAMPTRWAVAAVLFVGVAFAMLWLGLRRDHIETAIGEQRTFVLKDGSVVYVNTDSELVIDVSKHRRSIDLLRGEARFDVVKDPSRPFIVTTPQASVRAVGTSFNVQTVFNRTAVAVIEGRVDLTSKQAPGHDATPQPHMGSHSGVERRAASLTRMRLAAGERAAVTYAGDIVPREGPPLERVLAWTQRRVEFHDEPLATVIAEFNRYSAHPVYIGDQLLSGHRISGSFGIRDVNSLLQFLEQYQGVRIEQNLDGSRLLLRRPSASMPRIL